MLRMREVLESGDRHAGRSPGRGREVYLLGRKRRLHRRARGAARGSPLESPFGCAGQKRSDEGQVYRDRPGAASLAIGGVGGFAAGAPYINISHDRSLSRQSFIHSASTIICSPNLKFSSLEHR